MTKKLRAYILYNRQYGPQEYAFLIFHFTGREARNIFLPWWCPLDFVEFTDIAWRRIWDEENVFPLANQEKLANNQPHIVESPECCETCHLWGCGVHEDMTCKHCGESPGETLLELFEKEGL